MASITMNPSKLLYAVVALVAGATILVTFQLMTSESVAGRDRDVMRRAVEQRDSVESHERTQAAPTKEATTAAATKASRDWSDPGGFSFTFFPRVGLGTRPLDYPFSDPKTYSGPIVEGWPPSRSRDMVPYIRPLEDNILTDTSCVSLSGAKMLVIIQSSPELVERRTLNRLTWMESAKEFPDVKVLFLFGTTADAKVMESVQKEAMEHCDLVQLDFVDSYTNVTMDTVSGLKVALGWRWAGHEPDFLVMGDDDTYLNVPALWKLLFHDRVAKRTDGLLLGSRFITPQVMEPEDPKAEFVPRVETPSYLYSAKHYTDSMGGAGYVLPWTTLKCLYSESLHLPFFHINDIFVAGFCAERCGFPRVHNDAFHAGQVHPKDVKPTDVVMHWAPNEHKVVLHHILAVQKGLLWPKLPNAYHVENGELRYCAGDTTNCAKVQI